MNTEEHKFLWEMREFAKAQAGKLLTREFLGKNHPYKWRCSEMHIFIKEFWDLKDGKYFCELCRN